MSKYFKAEDVINLLATEYYTHALANSLVKVEDYKVVAERNTKHLPTIEVSEDCISRKRITDRIILQCELNDEYDVQHILEDIKNASSVVPIRAEGEWLFKRMTDDYHIIGQCSLCKELRRIGSYCPNCGAKMKGKRGNE